MVQINQLVLNYNKTHYLQFNMKNSKDHDLKLNYQGNYIKSFTNTKFLGLIIDDSLSWTAHIDQMMSKLNTACFVIGMIQAMMSQETLRMVYFAYVHSIMSYGIIFWGNQPHSEKIFKIQKRVIRIITNSRARDLCRESPCLWDELQWVSQSRMPYSGIPGDLPEAFSLSKYGGSAWWTLHFPLVVGSKLRTRKSYHIISYHIYSPSVDLYRYGMSHSLHSMQGICHNTLKNGIIETSGRLHPLRPQKKQLHTQRITDYKHTRQDRRIQKEMASTHTKNATKLNSFKILQLQTARKKINWTT